jgi:hypothetical protein
VKAVTGVVLTAEEAGRSNRKFGAGLAEAPSRSSREAPKTAGSCRVTVYLGLHSIPFSDDEHSKCKCRGVACMTSSVCLTRCLEQEVLNQILHIGIDAVPKKQRRLLLVANVAGMPPEAVQFQEIYFAALAP